MTTLVKQPAATTTVDALSELSDKDRELVRSLGASINGRLSKQGEENIALGQELRQIKGKVKRRWLPWVDQYFAYSLPVANGLIHIADWRDKYPEVLDKLPVAVKLAILNWALPSSIRDKVAEMVLAGETVTFEVFENVKGAGKTALSKPKGAPVAPTPTMQHDDEAETASWELPVIAEAADGTGRRDIVVERHSGWQPSAAAERSSANTIVKPHGDQITTTTPEGVDAQAATNAVPDPAGDRGDAVPPHVAGQAAELGLPQQIDHHAAQLRELAVRLYESQGYRYDEVRPALLPVVELVRFLGDLKAKALGAPEPVAPT